MKSLYAMFTASLLLTVLPIAIATHTGCSGHPPAEGIAHPLAPGRFLVVDPSNPANTGEWQDTNKVKGTLQTKPCIVDGTLMYKADTKTVSLP